MLVRIPFVWENNPLYPLPPDYDDLTVDGQRLARVNACRQWMIPMGDLPVFPGFTPNDMRGDAAVGAHHFFKSYYLLPDPADSFDPYFYDDVPLASPDMHHDLIRIWAMHRLSLTIAPRGSAKTTVGKEDTLRRLITAPNYAMTYCTLVHSTAMLRSEQIREQAYHNRRLNDDFAPEYGGPLRPSKSEARTGVESWSLRNHSMLQPVSVEGRKRGIRPRRFRFDDPENDEKASTSMVNAREQMERMLFRLIMPMVLLRGTGVDWTATHVSKRHYSWHAMTSIETPEGPRSKDPRFDEWAKYHIKQMRLNPSTNKYESCWPAAWPVDEEEKTRLNLDPDTLTIADVRRKMGERAWLAEMQGQPGDSEERCFPLIAEHEDQFTWEFTNVDSALQDSPSISGASITFLRKDVADTYTRLTIPLRNLLQRSRLFACADYSYTSGPDSDYKTGVVLLHDPITNILLVLDIWAAQCTKDAALRALFTLCNKWRVPQLYIETVKGSIAFYTELADLVRTKSPRHMGLDHFPAVKALKVGTEPKESKIASLSFRFEHRLIKLPLWRSTEPALAALLAQIEGFNPEVAGGGLDHDDLLDTVAMSKFVLKGRRSESPLPGLSQSLKHPHQRLLEGEIRTAAGTNLGMALDLSSVPAADLLALIDSRDQKGAQDESRI